VRKRSVLKKNHSAEPVEQRDDERDGDHAERDVADRQVHADAALS
jgi:hypothetical protein